MRCRVNGETVHLPRTEEQKEATRLRKAAEREAHRERVMKAYPPSVRYAKAKFKPGKKTRGKSGGAKLPLLGLQ
jgi:hypothetical protein